MLARRACKLAAASDANIAARRRQRQSIEILTQQPLLFTHQQASQAAFELPDSQKLSWHPLSREHYAFVCKGAWMPPKQELRCTQKVLRVAAGPLLGQQRVVSGEQSLKV